MSNQKFKILVIGDKNRFIHLEKFLDFEDEIILNYYHYDIAQKGIEHNKISALFKSFKI